VGTAFRARRAKKSPRPREREGQNNHWDFTSFDGTRAANFSAHTNVHRGRKDKALPFDYTGWYYKVRRVTNQPEASTMTIKKLGMASITAVVFSMIIAACGTTVAPVVPVLSTPSGLGYPGAKVKVQWLGQSTTKITTPGGKVIVIDPWLTSNPKTPSGYKRLEALGRVDLILVTHAHFDHIADAPGLAKMHNVPVYGPVGLIRSMVALGMLPPELTQGFDKGGTITPFGPGIKITATRAEHGSELEWRNPLTGRQEVHVGGDPVGYIIEVENGFKIYHMGDTGLFGDMKFIGDYYKPDLILIPIGGHYVMNPRDAAVATREYLKPKYAIPIHYATVPLLMGTPEEYVSAVGSAPVKVITLTPGEQVEF
jgi:L-ascorbate metabolism protein UlaG (beta-lactamase superfamily)